MSDTPTDTTSFNTGTSSSTNKERNNDPLDTAQWTSYLPETFGIRDAVKKSSYRWCVREGCVPFAMIWVMDKYICCIYGSLIFVLSFCLISGACGEWRRHRLWVCKWYCCRTLILLLDNFLIIFRTILGTDFELVLARLLRGTSFSGHLWWWCFLLTTFAIEDGSITKK